MSDRETTGEAPNLLGTEALDLTAVSAPEMQEHAEQISAPEQAVIQPPQETMQPEAVAEARAAAIEVAREAPRQQDVLLSHVEEALSERLKDVYKDLPESAKPLFRKRGEDAAKRVREMIASGKVQEAVVLDLIEGWLKVIPQVSREYLIQEAKIITDQVLKVRA